ncbi:glycosyltransferase [Sediminibacterium sp.]|uniref:glycosyltransferase n=1 Tax=Sediminibacterium sp. TaxID=1917865 RepID=UPI003F6E77D1
MKVLWISNCILGGKESIASGSWLFGMKNIISNNVKLFNLTSSYISETNHKKYNDFEEYIIPNYSLINGLPKEIDICQIKKIIDEIEPDIIHIWGTEAYWGLLFSRGILKGNYILEIQGLLSSCYNVFYGGLSIHEIFKCFHFKELVKLNSFLPVSREKLKKQINREDEIISNSINISTQSDWVRNQLKFKINGSSQIFKTLVPIRSPFYNSAKWDNSIPNYSPTIFLSISYVLPFKGLHIVFKSISLLKKKYPGLKLNIAGPNIYLIPYYKKDGYIHFLISLIKKLGLNECIHFLGSLNAQEICRQLLNSNIFINPSFVESYSVASAEALYLGVPSILSFAGAMPNFSNENKIALYYSPMDYIDLASKIDIILENNDLAKSFSSKSIFRMSQFCDPELIKNVQLTIYDKIKFE